MTTNKLGCFAIFTVVIGAALLGAAKDAEAVTCNSTELISLCLPAFTSLSQPSSACCAKLKEQMPCVCQYAKDPAYAQYFTSPLVKVVEATCQVKVQC